MTTRTLLSAADTIAAAADLDSHGMAETYREAAEQHMTAANEILASSTDPRASERRQADWHIRQAEALTSVDGARIDYGQIIDVGTAPPDGEPSARIRSGYFRAAEAAIAECHRSGLLPSDAAETATRLLETGENTDQALMARYVSVTGSVHYRSAFARVVADPTHGHMEWTNEEREAYRQAAIVGREMRALALTGSTHYLVPFHLDPSVMLSSAGVQSPLRQVARVEQLVNSDVWHGVVSAGTTSEWLAEAAEATPVFTQPSITPQKLSTYSIFSVEAGGDAVRLLEQLQTLMLDEFNRATNVAYTTGTGTGEPKGFVTALAAVGASVIAPTTGESFTAADLYKVQNDLGPRFQDRASWLCALPIASAIAQFETTNGSLKFPEISGGTLLRRPFNELSTMDSTNDAAATANNYLLAYGSWKDAFVIVDRVGASLELVPHVLGTNRRPTGQRGAWMWARTGSDVVLPTAARLLNVATTA